MSETIEDLKKTVASLRDSLLNIFLEMDELDLEHHPMVVNEYFRMAELLGIDSESVPTESRALERSYPVVSRKMD